MSHVALLTYSMFDVVVNIVKFVIGKCKFL